MDSNSSTRRNIATLSVGLLLGAAFYLARVQNYLLFHSLVEVFTIGVAGSVFLVTWNARQYEDHGYFLFVGIGSLFAAGFSVVHFLSYKGMGVFPRSDGNLPTQLWIATRTVLAVTLLIAPRFAGRKLDHRAAFAAFAAGTALVVAAIGGGFFPTCYVEGTGLTPFKIYGEYVICAMFLGSAVFLLRQKAHFERTVLAYSVLAIVASILAELTLTLYHADVYGLFNMVGHYLAFAAYYFMYEAVVGTELVRKYALHEALTRELEERRRAEATVRHLASFPRLNPNPVIELDASGRISYLNPAAERVLEELGMSREDADAFAATKASALVREAREKPDTPLTRELAIGGRTFALTAHRAAALDVVRIYAHDITRQVESAQAVEAAHRATVIERNRFQAAMDALPVGLSIVDTQGVTVAANKAFERIWGGPRSATEAGDGYAAYKGCWVESGEPVRSDEWASARAVRAGEAVVGQLLRLARPDGTHAYVINSAAPIRGADGGIEGSVVAIMDITARFEAEAALRAAKEGLEARVAERTLELTQINEALRKEVAARRAAEESLGRTAEFLRTIEMSMRAGVSVVDLEGRYIYVNPAFCRIVGWREEELLGKGPPYPFWPPEDLERLRRIHETEMRGDALRGGSEARFRRRTGELFDALTLPSPLLDDTGRVTGRLTVVYDITERKTAERELLEANEKLNALIESSPLAIVVRGLDDLVTVWNPAAERMFEWRKEEVIGRPMPIIPPESAGQYRQLRDAILRGDGLRRIEFRRARKDGSPVDASISTALLRDAAGNVNGIMAIFEDVTERNRIQEELRESEARFRSFVENSPAGLCLVRGGRVFFTNPEMVRLFGPIPPGFEFRRYKAVVPDDREKFARLCDALERPEPPILEIDIRFVSGHGAARAMNWVHARTTPVEYHGGKATLVSLMDITRLKELEHLARAREKMASLGHVAAGIAHEIRNPLSGINIYLSNLEKVCEASDSFEAENRELVRNVVDQMRSASVKIESVIRRVMDFSRPHPVKLVPVNLNSAVDEAIALSQVSLRKQGVRVTKALDAALPLVRADLAMIEQVILNLLTNAAQAMERETGRREIEIASFREGDRAVISVSDSGPGVPVEIRDKIFDPFYTTRSDGSGIGLSICHRVVSDHGGMLSVRTGKWGGAEFRVVLPLAREEKAG